MAAADGYLRPVAEDQRQPAAGGAETVDEVARHPMRAMDLQSVRRSGFPHRIGEA